MSQNLNDREISSNSAGSECPGSAGLDWLSIWSNVCLAYRTDAEGRITYISPAVTDLLGYSPDELVGQDFKSYFQAIEQPDKEPKRLSPARGRTSRNSQLLAVVRRANGTQAFLELRERQLLSSAGVSLGTEGLAYDVTDHVNERLLAKRSEEKYRRLVEGLSGDYAIYTHAPDGTLTYVSPSVRRILGYPPEELIGKNWRELIGENFVGRDRAEQVRGEVDAGIRFHKFCVEICRADGEHRLMEIQQHPEFSESGEYLSMEGIAKDITEATRNADELKRLKDELERRVAARTADLVIANRRLVESEARYRSVVEDQTEFICRWKPGGIYTFVNQAYCRYRNKSFTELVGTSFFPHICDEDRARVVAEITRLTPENASFTSEHRVIMPDGTLRWNQWTNRALFNSAGVCREFQSVGRDITDLRLAEYLVREREDHLKRVSRLATMGELISGIAHEIHQPLHAAQLFAEAARRSLEVNGAQGIENAIECTREISSAILRTATIIRHLRSFTTTKRSEIELVDVNEVLREVSELLAFETRKANATITFDLDEQIPRIPGDRVQLQQVFVQFLRNAHEAMAENSPHDRQIHLRTRRQEDFVQIDVSDNGTGVTRADRERLFDPFYSTKPGRLGMGLSICRTIAESHHGQLLATSNLDRGMTFSLRLPHTGRFKR